MNRSRHGFRCAACIEPWPNADAPLESAGPAVVGGPRGLRRCKRAVCRLRSTSAASRVRRLRRRSVPRSVRVAATCKVVVDGLVNPTMLLRLSGQLRSRRGILAPWKPASTACRPSSKPEPGYERRKRCLYCD